MRHKHASRSGSSTAGTSIRDRYGFEVPSERRPKAVSVAASWLSFTLQGLAVVIGQKGYA